MFSLTGGNDVGAEGDIWFVTAAQSYPVVTLHPSLKKDMETKVEFATKSLLLLASLMGETRELWVSQL